MQEPSEKYVRVPGTRFSGGLSLVTRDSLWWGSDHLLLVMNRGYSEEYRRFYFRDIQAIVAGETSAWKVYSVVLSLFLWAGLAVLAFARWRGAGPDAMLVALAGVGFWLGLLAVNGLRGPTCATYLQTAVHRQRLRPLRRLRRTQRVVAALREKIEAAQGPLTPEMLNALSAPAASPVPAAPRTAAAAPPVARRVGTRTPLTAYRSQAHAWLFACLLADLCHSCLRFSYGGVTLLLASLVIALAMISSLVVALVRQRGTDLTQSVKALTWGALGYMAAGYLFGIVQSIVWSFGHPKAERGMWDYYRSMADASPHDSPVMLAMFGVAIVCAATIGFGGLLSLHMYNRSRRLRPAANPSSDAPRTEDG